MALSDCSHPRRTAEKTRVVRAERACAGVPLRGAARGIAVAAVLMAWVVLGATTTLAADPKAAASEIIRSKGCAACHYVPGVTGAVGTAGPSLKGLSTRERIAGGRRENTPENLREWLSNPKKVLPSTMMPNMGLSDEEITVLIAFFKTI